jgi:hypothetical protein
MSESEKRAIMGAALLEVEDAKAALALLRAKAQNWCRLHEKVAHLLARAMRDDAHLESAARDSRVEILGNMPAIAAAMNLDSILALDLELENALQRLKKAETAKRELGFS